MSRRPQARRLFNGRRRRPGASGAGPALMLAWFCRAAVVGLLAAASYAQPVAETRAPAPDLEGLAPLSAVPILETPPVDVSASRSADGPGEPYRFAEPFAVEVTPATHGRWETTSDGRTAVWRLRVRSAGAVSINLGFTRYRMPPGGRLRVHTPDGEDVVGPYTEADNKSHGELWTPLVSGDDVVIEVAVPADRVGDLELQLGSVNRGFRDLVATDPLRSHQSCHIGGYHGGETPAHGRFHEPRKFVGDGGPTAVQGSDASEASALFSARPWRRRAAGVPSWRSCQRLVRSRVARPKVAMRSRIRPSAAVGGPAPNRSRMRLGSTLGRGPRPACGADHGGTGAA